MNNLFRALEESPYSCALLTLNGVYWCVDGSGEGWTLTFGQEGFPPVLYETEAQLETVLLYLSHDLLQEDWKAVFEETR